MIKVLIVDDDNLVRKGLISLMPWDKFDMQVVGEAKNGEKALDFLESNEVDLMLTDLAMPVMSGMELMRHVRSRYPQIFIVVLTLHQDFEYIQEALRLGAIDYIAKVQLEKESFEEVIIRIRNRILEEQKKNYQDDTESPSELIESEYGYVLITALNSFDPISMDKKEVVNTLPPIELDSDLWLWLPAEDKEDKDIIALLSKIIMKQEDWGILKLEGIKGQKKHAVHRLLREYKEHHFFYDFHPDHKIHERSIDNLVDPPPINEDKLNVLKKHWLALGWVHQVSVFEYLMNELKSLQLSPHKLVQFLNLLVNAWNRIYSSVTFKQIELPDSFRSWCELEVWLYGIRDLMMKAIGKSQYSEEVQSCITRSVQIMHEEISSQVHASDMAKRVNMSRSYFSQCFKELVGMTFNEYLRHIRIEKAKEYLQQTKKTIQWVSENTGYADEKYFSRIFREKIGMLPSEYRQSFGTESNMSDS